MEYPWRPMPQTGNLCPICSNPHYPFCPPPPTQYYRPPPPPPDQFFHSPLPPPPPAAAQTPSATPYDPFVDHQGGPASNHYPPPPAQIPPRPWNPNPNYSYEDSNPGLDYNSNVPVGAKRMRFDNVYENYAARPLAEDERRLKLIRDHGAVGQGLDMNHSGGYRLPSHSSGQSNFGENRSPGDLYGERQYAYLDVEKGRNVCLGHMMQNQGYGYNIRETHTYTSFRPANGVQLDDKAAHQEQRQNVATESWELKNQFSQFPETHSNKQHAMEPRLGPYAVANQVQPPLPISPPPPPPPPPLPVELPRFQFAEHVVSSSSPFQSPFTKEIHTVTMASSSEKPYRDLLLDKPKVIDASHILKHPHRSNRPDHIVIILRGLPGSGKSYLAKFLRDLEVENGGTVPRVYSMDEYFMTEVEKVEESEGPRSSGSVRGKKTVTKKVMEYCYEPEMEEAYRSSMLKAFKKTLVEGAFPFVIVDDRNLRVADFTQFWATAKRSGYEVYLLEAEYKDPAGCAARNVHGFTQNEIHEMARRWEEAPSLYMKLDIKSLLRGDDLEENGIQEVDMDTEDDNHVGGTSGSMGTNVEKIARPSDGDLTCEAPLKDEEKTDDVQEHQLEVVKELGKSKWSNDLDEDDLHKTETTMGSNSIVLSGLVKPYSKKGKSVRWADQIGRIGFSIGGGKAANVSLIIGAGSGYNSKSNPLPEEEKLGQRNGELRRRNVFQERLRAESESFRAVFDKRRQRISGLHVDYQ
ncbi:P-loop containing nucleoside triphosphatehydrolases superfamily protein [Striga asiatica]|uniref:P-loop containing nucleoside triphosphatehydrolases superfamily protein n=1 Tax=Striga asiatica TaxID=4170 RepID=A0A5A7QZW1_STRAF|nr:P-loop containing nucleoside triphosphatehydrolases superfamily protein [Striga asiatica]